MLADFSQQVQNQSPGLEVNEKRRRDREQRQRTQGKRGNDPRCERPGELPGREEQRRSERQRRENIPEEPGPSGFRQEFSIHDRSTGLKKESDYCCLSL